MVKRGGKLEDLLLGAESCSEILFGRKREQSRASGENNSLGKGRLRDASEGEKEVAQLDAQRKVFLSFPLPSFTNHCDSVSKYTQKKEQSEKERLA